MARKALRECPDNVWFAEGSFSSFKTTLEKLHTNLARREEDKSADVVALTTRGTEPWVGAKDFTLRVRWEASSHDGLNTADITAVVTLWQTGPLMGEMDMPGGIEDVLKALLTGNGPDMELDCAGGWRIVAAAPEGTPWDRTWPSPAGVIFGTKASLHCGDADSGMYSLHRVNHLCLVDRNRMRKALVGLSRNQGLRTVIFNEGSDDSGTTPNANAFLDYLHGGDCGRTAVFAVHDHSLLAINEVLDKDFKTQLTPGGALLLPHTPHRGISRRTLQASNLSLPKGAEDAMEAYYRIPDNLDPITASMLDDLDEVLYSRSRSKPEPEKAPTPASPDAGAARREKALQETVDGLRADLRAAQEKLGTFEDQGARVADLERRLQEAEARADSDVMRRVAGAAALRVKELEAADEERVRELDDMAAKVAWLSDQLARAGKVDLVDQPVPERSFSSWDELFTAAQEAFPRVVIGPEVLPNAKELGHFAQSASWMVKTWRTLETLNNYAEDVERYPDKPEVAQLFSYVRWSGARSLIAAGLYRANESKVTQKNDAWFRARVFPVPTSVSESGEAFMGEHAVIGGGAHPAPRMHLLDATKIDGMVYVGYVGAHLPNTLS